MRAGLSARGISRVELSLAIGFAFSLVPITVLAQTPESVVDSIKQMQTEIRGIQKHYEMEMRQLEQRHRSEMLKLQRQLDELKAAKAPTPAPAFPSPTTAAPAALSYAPAGLPPAPAVGQPPTAAALPPPPQADLPPPVSAEAKRGGFMNTGIELTLGGQDWTFLTLFNHGLSPRQERVPLTIDNQLVPGFTWVRQPQFRVVQDLDSTTSIGLSLESPQASVFSGPNAPLVPTTFSNTGGLHLNSLATYSTDITPDIIAKAAYDPDVWGHYEAYGIARLFRSPAAFKNDTVWSGAG